VLVGHRNWTILYSIITHEGSHSIDNMIQFSAPQKGRT